MSSLFAAVPEAPTNAWNLTEDVNVLDDPLVQGPAPAFLGSPYGGMGFGYFPGRTAQGVLPALMKTSVQVTEAAGDSVTLHRTFLLESWMRTGSEARVSATGEGEMVFSQKLGAPESVELRCKTIVATENVSRRTTATLRWKLLKGAERDAALNPPPPVNPNEVELSATELATLTEKLKSEEQYNREDAVRRIASAKMSSPSPELMSQMVRLVNDPDDSIDNYALTFVANHATDEHAMLLIKSLNTSDQTTRTAIVRALGKLADKRAAEPLADMLARGPTDQLQYSSSRNNDVPDALIRIGPAAEPAVLALLKERNNATRWQACYILKRIGTLKSLPALKEVSLSASKELSEAASDAYRMIEAREK